MAKAQTIVKLTAETNDYEKKMRAANKSFNDFMKGVGMSPAKLNAMALAVGATTTALKVAKDAFFANEQQLDEWGRIVESSKSIYKGFLDSLNNGDISGFLSNIRNIIGAARDAYNALDNLNTFNAFNQRNVQRARTGFAESIAGFREGTGSKTGVENAALLLKSELQKRKLKEEEAYDKSLRQLALQRGVSYNDLKAAFSAPVEDFERMKNVRGTGGVKMNLHNLFSPIMNQEFKATNDAERLGEALNRLNDTEINSLQALGAQADRTAEEIANIDKQVARIVNGRGGGAGGSGGGARGGRGGGGGGTTTTAITYAADSIAAQEALVSELTKKWKEAGAAVRDDYLKQLNEAQWKLDDMKNPQSRPMLAAPTDIMSALAGKGVEEKVTVPQEALEKIAEEVAKAMAGPDGTSLNVVLGDMASGMSQMVSGMEQLGIDIPDGIKSAIGAIQGISSILTGIFSTLLAIKALAAVDTLIPGLARGGIIPRAAGGYFVGGRNFSSDITPIMANAGELVLNRAQQGVLAQQLSNNHLSNMHLSASLTGETITLAVNAHNRRVGRGEVATTRNRRYGNMDS
jgi:hypothetical protein